MSCFFFVDFEYFVVIVEQCLYCLIDSPGLRFKISAIKSQVR
ncbi:hypothetical protein HanXRQr2_Chr09g0368751 [Helianthus annuus]|uniref:Uncharacterized protein n=1 Tax=Helianthus annuus TaxID=4232 RepID=A0A9K3I2J6_HELAN|nr:hypothetical protein HanXRQr2_Chr09g0368751 [Helianthus annuus]KAJ0532509.1 hypothetical protein HanIR_Chr09g0397691 [Helianthus annuus]KAJ0540978.1 hypothetical protein HanHA89_Chr09g0323201 [Helianthus annuus]